MKILDTSNFVSERARVKPITNSEWDSAKKELEKIKPNPFGLKKEDLTGKIENFPMGVVVRMMEEMKKQDSLKDENHVNIFILQKYLGGAFEWIKTKAGPAFWSDVINDKDFNLFFEEYPEYRKYNLD